METPGPAPHEYPFAVAQSDQQSHPEEYDMRLLPSVEKLKPSWFDSIPWQRSSEFTLNDEALNALTYMGRIEGHVCSGYLMMALASAEVRAHTEATDFVGGAWGPQENWHGIAIHRFRDQYEGRTVSTRAEEQDRLRAEMSAGQRHAWIGAAAVGAVTPISYTAVYASMGYRNELMTMRGYGSLLGKVNEQVGQTHPVVDPMLRNIMREESDHAQYYHKLATQMLEGRPGVQKITRRVMNKWWGLVGENFGGKERADRVVRYLFSDARGRDIAASVDRDVSSLPGLSGIRPTQDRVEAAL